MFEKTRNWIRDGVDKAYPCAAAAVGCGATVYLREFAGVRQRKPSALPLTEDTLFDLASMTKALSTAMIALKLFEKGALSPDDKLRRHLDIEGNYADVAISHLLTHTAGFAPHMPLWRLCEKDECLRVILDSEPLNPVGEAVHYSCLGYIVLGKLLECVTGKKLDILAREYVFDPLGMKTACYVPHRNQPYMPVAATEFRRDLDRRMCGAVHDENAYHMDGVAGNAGVFATLDDVIAFVTMCALRGRTKDGEVYLPEKIFASAIQNRTPDGAESRGYGFQLKGKQPSPLGDAFSFGSYGHTGFTGTSFYIDAKSGLWGILLTNSVYDGRDNRAAYYPHRRQFYQILEEEFQTMRQKGEI